MRRLPLFFLIAVLSQPIYAETSRHSGNSGSLRASNDDRVNDYNRNIEAAIRNSKDRYGYDRMVVYTGYEPIFKQVDKPGDYRVPYGTGANLISQLKDFPGKCIPNLTILSHGWGASRTSGGKGLPIAENSLGGFPVTGIYTDEAARMSEVHQSVNDYMTAHAETIRRRFKEINGREATSKDIAKVRDRTFARYNEVSKANSANLSDLANTKFCTNCLIQIYSCNLDNDFVLKLAQTTGCQIVYGTGKATGHVTGKSSDGSPEVTVTGYRSSDKVEENGKVKYVNLNTRDGNFRRITPLKDSRGRIYDIHQENVGTPLVNKNGSAYGYTYKLFK